MASGVGGVQTSAGLGPVEPRGLRGVCAQRAPGSRRRMRHLGNPPDNSYRRFQRSKGWVPMSTLKLPTAWPGSWGVWTFRKP